MKIKNLLYVLLACSVGLSSCSKFLDKNPDMRAEINSVENLKRLVASAYPSANHLLMTEVYSDNVEDKGVGSLEQMITNFYNWQDINDNGTNTPTDYWNKCYEAISVANHALKAIEEGNFGEDVLPYKGEALVARAYAHFMLVTLYSQAYQIGGDNSSPGVPYVTEPENVVIKQYERGTVASVYENIRKDLEEGLPLLKGGKWEVPKYHFTPESANAFAARFYLFTGQWQKVVDHANAIFAGGNFAGKLRPYNTTFKTLGFNEVNIVYTKADQPYNLMLSETYSTYQRFSSVRHGMGVNVFQKVLNGITAAGQQFYNFGLSYGTPHYTTYVWKEFFYITDAAANTGFPMLMVPTFTSDEALMNRAEAYAQLGQNAKAIADLNLLASNRIDRYNPTAHEVTLAKAQAHFEVTDPKKALINTVLEFKRVVFMQEGMRWFDIIRHRLPVKHIVIDDQGNESFIELGPDDKRRVFQIPQETKLSGLEQNPR
ncbi:RagB/SusD family nutrient uptake outer membrane protein [Sphingobacterium sp. DK4209]|uniref:RagB/SusD family nutrient uptake outer membrane protein n=1 Tax=Sphingobacterium zhuxiongii TaxID=2662364 RepID=A0A5Q0Q786_9SPHI|nr:MULTISPECIES: RagB/SusD family nutrient uptake outer membrane protein [unclassified Sphingobacterium]MVZ66245.1 RagB/SusD family nutrient uptake outer membrane protein [Sphingobacterium sp. DK4209]QGA24969.1 RagB/SusD family nutrient uptake outer membrane protein [Sphingobacterium sp. dk4302]